MEQMRSSKGFGIQLTPTLIVYIVSAMSKGKSSERVDEYSAELNKQIHKELQEIHESAKEVTRDLFNSPDGNNAKAFDGNSKQIHSIVKISFCVCSVRLAQK